MQNKNLKINSIYSHSFNNAELATTRLMEDLSSKESSGHFLRIAPNIFLYISADEGNCNMVAATPLHYFYSNLETAPNVDDTVNENDEVENDETDSTDENSNSDLSDSIHNDVPCDDGSQKDLTNNVLIDNQDDGNSNVQNIDLAHNSLASDNEINTNPIKMVSVVLPIDGQDLFSASKDIENKIQNKYNGQIFRHNDLMFTHIRPDGVIDRVTTDESGHNCTSYK